MMQQESRRVTAIVAVLSVAALLSSCGRSDDATTTHVEEMLWPSGPELVANRTLVEEKTQLCMIAQGFEYQIRVPSVEAATVRFFPRLGSLTLEQADNAGFGFAENPGESSGPGASRDPKNEAELHAEFEAFLQCQSVSEEEVNGQYRPAVAAVLERYDDLVESFNAKSEVIALESEWSTCMRQSGFENAPDTFAGFAQGYLDERDRAVLGRAGKSDDEWQLQLDQMLISEKFAARAAVQCADPVRDTHNELWMAHQRAFVEQTDIPQIPQS